MDRFLGYSKIQIKPKDQHKMKFIFPWGTFSYQKNLFGLKNVEETFQGAMTFPFHYIKHIVKPYLDESLHTLARE
jgi:hypothetical protein